MLKKNRRLALKHLNKELPTFLPCVNGDGSHKLKMIAIGKSKNPRAFRNCAFLVEYHATKNAWMTDDISLICKMVSRVFYTTSKNISEG